MPNQPEQPDETRRSHRRPGGIVHAYLGYDPGRFPSPTSPPPDLASAAMEHALRFGKGRRLTREELANAVKLDPSQIAGLGPSLDALIAMLEARKKKILETYETSAALRDAARAFDHAAQNADPPKKFRDAFDSAVKRRQVYLLERLWYAIRNDTDPFAQRLLRAKDRLGDLYEVEQLDGTFAFTGREPMSVERAIEVKEELEAIDRLLEQLREAMKTARVGLIDLDELREFVDEASAEGLEDMQRRVRDYIDRLAEQQGLDLDGDEVRPSPKTVRLFQSALLDEIFSELEGSRTGRHDEPVAGDGAVESPKTRPYAFGDAASNLDVPQSILNAAARVKGGTPRPRTEDLVVHETRVTPRCATAVLIDMSGSMRHGGQYVECKRMALALDGLIRKEYPGDYLACLEMATFARLCAPGELAELMPKPVTLRDPVVRLRANMADPDISEAMVPPHFTNIQHGLSLARRLLAAQDTPNRQVMLITDGLPTAHFEERQLYMLYPPDPLTERATMREAAACAKDGITINIFLLPSWSQTEDDVAFAHRLAEGTKGRVFFTGGDDLDRFVLWDYVRQRRRIIG